MNGAEDLKNMNYVERERQGKSLTRLCTQVKDSMMPAPAGRCLSHHHHQTFIPTEIRLVLHFHKG